MGVKTMTYGQLAVFLAVLSAVLYSLNGELIQFLQISVNPQDSTHASPLMSLLFCHSGGLLFAPHFIMNPPTFKLPPWHIPAASCILALLLMGYNYAWVRSAMLVPVGLTNSIFQTTVATTYIASLLIGEESVSLVKVIGVLLAVCGGFLASGVGDFHESTVVRMKSLGISLAFLAAVGQTAYQVVFRRLYPVLKMDASFIAYFGMWVSFMHVIVVLPLIFTAHVVGMEAITLPNHGRVIFGTVVTAVVAFMVNAMVLCVVAWGSPMLLPGSYALSIPVTLLCDLAIHHVHPMFNQLVGQTLIITAFFALTDAGSLLPGGKYLSGKHDSKVMKAMGEDALRHD